MCLKDLRDEFLYDCECRHLAKGSLRNYRAATRFLVDFLELRRITELEAVKPHHIRDLMKEKQDMGSTPRYINDLLKVWRTWFNYLVTEGYLDERDNPARKVKPLRQPKTIIDTFTVDYNCDDRILQWCQHQRPGIDLYHQQTMGPDRERADLRTKAPGKQTGHLRSVL